MILATGRARARGSVSEGRAARDLSSQGTEERSGEEGGEALNKRYLALVRLPVL